MHARRRCAVVFVVSCCWLECMSLFRAAPVGPKERQHGAIEAPLCVSLPGQRLLTAFQDAPLCQHVLHGPRRAWSRSLACSLPPPFGCRRAGPHRRRCRQHRPARFDSSLARGAPSPALPRQGVLMRVHMWSFTGPSSWTRRASGREFAVTVRIGQLGQLGKRDESHQLVAVAPRRPTCSYGYTRQE